MFFRRFLLLTTLLLLAAAACAQSKDSVLTDGAPGTARPQAVWRAPQTPRAGSGFLETLGGSWRITASLWLAGPDRPPLLGAGEGNWRTLFGSRYVEIRDSLTVAGSPLTVLGYVSWEGGREPLQLALFTSTGQSLLATGRPDSAWADFTATAAAPRPLRVVQRGVNGNRRQLEVYATTAAGREYKLIAAEYLRTSKP
jgi:hypothetical protein